MATAPNTDGDPFDEFLSARGHETGPTDWEESYNKKQCPECGGVHDADASECSVCGWRPAAQ
ncbi:HVO_0416 family zinc finger protein [Halobaculum sp. MBLA0143]|uniref:HVO_0416 family zinc finger protein n=1 Tax=Halobaculum sp. MBLA0143 TaxID=3079933 RepID=UPI003524ED65